MEKHVAQRNREGDGTSRMEMEKIWKLYMNAQPRLQWRRAVDGLCSDMN